MGNPAQGNLLASIRTIGASLLGENRGESGGIGCSAPCYSGEPSHRGRGLSGAARVAAQAGAADVRVRDDGLACDDRHRVRRGTVRRSGGLGGRPRVGWCRVSKDPESVLLHASMLGAPVMPHAVSLHSSLVRDRHGFSSDPTHIRRLLTATRWDVALSLGLAGTVNMPCWWWPLPALRALSGRTPFRAPVPSCGRCSVLPSE